MHGFAHALEDLDQVLKAPQVDPRLGLVEHGQRRAPGQDRGDLDALEFTAGQTGVHLPVDIVPGAQAHGGQVFAGPRRAQLLPGGDADKVHDLDAFEPDRLLKGVGDAQARPVGDALVGDVLAPEKDAALGGLFDACDEPGQGALAAAVGAGDDHQLVLGDVETHPADDLLVPLVLRHLEGHVFQFQHISPSLLHIVRVLYQSFIGKKDFFCVCRFFSLDKEKKRRKKRNLKNQTGSIRLNDTPQIKFFGTTFLSRKVVRFYSFQLYYFHPHRSVALDPAPEAEGVVPVSMALAGEAGVDLEYAAASQMSIRFMVVSPLFLCP